MLVALLVAVGALLLAACSTTSNTTVSPAASATPGAQLAPTQPPAPSTSSPGADSHAVDTGHADAFHVSFENGKLTMSFAYDGPCNATFPETRYYDPASVVMYVKPGAEITVPSGFDFLGAAGAPIWLLPQAQECDLLWPGLNTESETLTGWGTFEFTLQSVEGPGDFVLFTTGSFGSSTVLWDLSDGARTFSAPIGTHAHYNWAFTKPGRYTIVVEAAGSHSQHGRLSTGPVSFQIVVGEGAGDTSPRGTP